MTYPYMEELAESAPLESHETVSPVRRRRKEQRDALSPTLRLFHTSIHTAPQAQYAAENAKAWSALLSDLQVMFWI